MIRNTKLWIFAAALLSAALSFSLVSCEPEQEEETIAVARVELPTEFRILLGGTCQLPATIAPSDATDPKLTWVSSAPTVASVDDKGFVTALSLGETTVTASASNGKKASCKITVVSKLDVTGVKLDMHEVWLETKDESKKKATLTATVLPDYVAQGGVVWNIDDENIASLKVDAKNPNKAEIVAKASGSAKVVVTTVEGGFTDTCLVEVRDEKVTGVHLNLTKLTMGYNSVATLKAAIEPLGADSTRWKWETSDSTVVAIQQGKYSNAIIVSQAKEGTVTISVTTMEGEFSASCEVTVIKDFKPTTALTLDAAKLAVDVSKTVELTATVTPDTVTNRKNLVWSVNDATLLSIEVDEEGNIATLKGLKAGTAIVTVTSPDGGLHSSCEVVVSDIPVTAIAMERPTLGIKVKTEASMGVEFTPADATHQVVYWFIADTSIAKVDSITGVVSAVKVGKTTLIAKVKEDMTITAECEVDVVEDDVLATGVTLDKTAAELFIGDELQLAATIAPANATKLDVEWATSDKKVATVDENGLVTAIAKGEVTITATSNKIKAECKITVKEIAVTGITMTADTFMYTGGKLTLKHVIEPENATNTEVEWTTSDEKIATVENGVVTALKEEGTVTITAKTKDGGHTATCKIAVDIALKDIAVSTYGITLDAIGATETIVLTYTPEKATNKVTEWISSNPAVATVDADGKVTAVGAGMATITVTVTDRETKFVKSCGVEVVLGGAPVTPTTYAISVAEGIENGTVTVAPAKAAEGAEVTITVTPANGFQLKAGTLKAYKKGEPATEVSINAENKFTMPAYEVEVTAEFEAATAPVTTYAITMGTFTNGNVTPDKTEAAEGETVTLTVSPADGYRLKAGTLKFNGTDVTENAGVYTFTMPAAEVTVTAEFEAIPPTMFTITVVADPAAGGSVTGGGSYAENSTATLTATANNGYTFTQWSDGNTDNPRTVTVAGDATYTAEFTLNTYTISVTANPTEGGTVTGANTYNHGDNVTLTATANTGYRFVKWTEGGNEVSTNATYSFNAEQERNLVAEFEAIFTITVDQNITNGTVTPNMTEAAAGDIVTITVAPDDSYQLTANSLTVTGAVSSSTVTVTGSGDTYTFVMPAEAVTVTAAFEGTTP